MNLGLWGSPPALSQVSTNEAPPPPVLLVATSHTARQPAQRPLPAGCTVTHVLWGALQSPHFRVSRAWLHVPAAQLLPSERPCLAEPVSSSCVGGDEGAVTWGGGFQSGSERPARHGGEVLSGASHQRSDLTSAS